MSPAAKPSVNAERRVRRAIQRAERDGTEITVASVARAAKVDRTFLYRRPDLLAAIQEHAAGREDGNGETAGTGEADSREPHTGTRILTHGATGWKRGCRCDVCAAGRAGHHSGKRGSKPARLQDEDRRTERASVPLSPRELALVDRARGKMTRGQFLREAVMEGVARDLGMDPADVDPARRAGESVRRANYSERAAAGKTSSEGEG